MIRKTNRLFALMLLLTSIPSFAATIPVNIKDFQFAPNNITINLGDSVKWSNQDAFAHTTTEDSNPVKWDKTLAANSTYTRQFNTEGTFNYHCKFHPSMKAKITVRSAEQSRINIGKSIITANPKKLPITLNLTGKNLNQVYLGSYIVNAQSGCADCHSCPTYAPGHNPYKGESKQFNATAYLAGGVSFGGLISANLTPDNTGVNAGRPAGLTRTEFKNLLRSGHDPDAPKGTLLQVMPWPIFGMMDDHDLDAVYEYLSSIPKASTPNPACPAPGQ